jgi:HAE1 family hydrophobic/amphiphilic exporter-1
MNLSYIFIKRPIMTALVMAAIVIVGIASYNRLPVSSMPDVAYPYINVSAKYPGGSPETMANNVATPLEQEFLTISGLVHVSSNNTLGSTSIILQFDFSKDIDSAAIDVEAAISRAGPHLPANLPSAPTYKKVNPSQTSVIYFALTSETMPLNEMYDYANNFIGQRFALIDGVAEVQTYGSPYAVRVQVDPGKMASLGVTLEDVSQAISEGNPYLPQGGLDGPVQAPTIITDGQLKKAEAYQPLIVRYQEQSPLRIQDIGKAIDSLQNYKNRRTYFEHDLELPAVILAINPQPGANVVHIADEVYKKLPAIHKELPPSLTLRKIYDRSESIRDSFLDVQFTLIVAFVLVVLIIYLYLGKAVETIIPAIVLPISVIGTFAFMRMLDFSLDNLSLMALILSVGFIIDDAIVVIENIVRHVEAGENPWKAAMEGSKQISFTILSMTLSLIAVFIPILFMTGLLGKILAEFAVTLTLITLLSGFISLTLTPMLCTIFIRPREKNVEIEERPHIGMRINNAMLRYYKPSLLWILGNRFLALVILIISAVFSVYLIIILPKDLMPNDDVGFFIVYTQAAQGTSSERMVEYQNEVANILKKDPNIERFVSLAPFQTFRNGLAFTVLKPHDERKPIMEVIGNLWRQTSQLIGINAFFKNIPMIDLSVGFQVKGAYQYILQSINSQELYSSAKVFLERMKAMPGLQGVSSDLEIDTPQLFVNIRRNQASTLGVTAFNIENALQLAYAGGKISTILTPINQYDVILELDPEFQKYPSALDLIYVRSETTNQLVPLRAVAEWKIGVGPDSVNHINQFPSVTISFNLSPEVSLGDVLADLEGLAAEVLPSTVSGKVTGAAQTFQESVTSGAFLLILTIIIIYIVLGILYESFVHPITILTTLPPATLGGLLTLYLFGLPLSLYSFLGLILLIGIVKKNGIMMVDFALANIHEKGESPEKSIYEASIVRFRPIMMTTLTAIMGALPIALGVGAGAEGRRPLGLVIIGGLILSQMITLFITPVIYLYLEPLNKKLSILSSEEESIILKE